MSERKSFARYADGLMAGVMLGILCVLLVPLPPLVLDLALTLNLSLAIVVLLITLTVKAPLDFSTFPSLLLFTTLLRLGLNVASTRLILGGGNAGKVIQGFGDFVVGGNLVVGLVIFLILVIIQFVVITKGSNRISEVAARFTLDAMPGKQMAIDADLNAGLITENDARARRENVSTEAEFYGAMDGAGKFVRGDAIAGLIITMINIVGGVAIGIGKDLPILDALRRYAILTVGDGLVSQIPALVIAISAGTLVTKAKSESQLSVELVDQFMRNTTALRIASGIIFVLGLLPGLPFFPFAILSGTLFLLARAGSKSKTPVQLTTNADSSPVKPSEFTPEALEDALRVDRLATEIGFRLVPLVEKGSGGLLEHIGLLRRQFAQRMGFVVPPIRLRDNLSLPPNAYRVLMSGDEIGRGELHPGHLLAMNPGGGADALRGIETTDPTFGLPATWIPESDRALAESLGYTVIEPEAVLVTHLTEVIRDHAHEILSREDVQGALKRVKETQPTIVNELVPDVLSTGIVQKVLSNLLRDRIPILNLAAILEALADASRQDKDPHALTEAARLRLARLICEVSADRSGKVPALTMDPALEQQLADVLGGNVSNTPLSPTLLRDVQDAVVAAWQRAQRVTTDPVLVVRPTLRRHLAELLRPLKPPIPVLSLNEIVAARAIESVGVVSLTPTRERAGAHVNG